jgi:hypothetical protein
MPAFLGLGPDNPIVWGNFYRKGGFRTMSGTAAAYFGILVVLIFLSARLDPRAANSVYAGWASALLGLQVLFMVVIGAGRVTSTIRGDLTSGMLESLRMMPLAARHAVAGYLSATAATLAGFFAANFLLGLVVTAMADLPAARWVAGNAILFAFALLVWTISAFMAFQVKSAGAVLVIVSIVGVLGNFGVFLVAPGSVVLAGPLIGATVFNLRTAQTELATPLVVSIAGQLLVGSIFFAGAARKYRRPDALALGALLGMALLLTVIGISLLAIVRFEDFQPGFIAREFQTFNRAVPFCGSAVLCLLIAMIPLANFARLHVGWKRGRADDPSLRRAGPPLLPAALTVTAVLALLVFALPARPGPARLACIVAALFGFCASVVFVAGWSYRFGDNAKATLAVWLAIYCLGPLALDFARDRLSAAAADTNAPMLATTASFSPVGLLIEAATQPGADLRAGAVFHALIPLLPIGLYLRAARARRRRAVTSPAAGRPTGSRNSPPTAPAS